MQLYHLRIDNTTNDVPQHLPFTLSHGTNIFVRRADVFLKGTAGADQTALATIEYVTINLFGSHSTGVGGTHGSSDILIPVFGLATTRQEHTVRHPIDNLSITDSITPRVSATTFAGTAFTLTTDRKVIVHLLLEVEKERDTSGLQGANENATRKTAASLMALRQGFVENANESRMGKKMPGNIKFGIGQY